MIQKFCIKEGSGRIYKRLISFAEWTRIAYGGQSLACHIVLSFGPELSVVYRNFAVMTMRLVEIVVTQGSTERLDTGKG